jgi:hypothetical protein
MAIVSLLQRLPRAVRLLAPLVAARPARVLPVPPMRAPALRGRAAAVTGAIAAAAVASAALIAWRTRRAEAQNPAAGGVVEVDGVRLHYVDRGSGPAVVLLHATAA